MFKSIMFKLKNIQGRVRNRINKRLGSQERRNQKEPSLMMLMMRKWRNRPLVWKRRMSLMIAFAMVVGMMSQGLIGLLPGEENFEVVEASASADLLQLGYSTIIQGWNVIDDGYVVEAFTDVGSHTWDVPAGVTEVDVLVVGGGGGGGASAGGSAGGGGGGAGGLIFEPNFSLSDSSYQITVGAGGSPGATSTDQNGNDGEDSSFGNDLVAIGGGGGGERFSEGRDGGSGGGSGGRTDYAVGGSYEPPPPQSPQGNYGGGSTLEPAGNDNAGGGGGGYSSEGQKGDDNTKGGDGGAGRSFGNIFGSEFGDNGYFAGGGGGGISRERSQDPISGVGGIGGGGDGGLHQDTARNGEPNTGGGGGGAGRAGGDAGAGGSGIVLVRYRQEYVVEAFTDVGSHTWEVPDGVEEVDVLVVGGGGGGGNVRSYNSAGGGGGGAGGVVHIPNMTISDSSYNVTVGAGAEHQAVSPESGNDGEHSSFGNFVALGGGGGTGHYLDTTPSPGGSGGGARNETPYINLGGGAITPSETPAPGIWYGNKGGDGIGGSGNDQGGGGGGGAGGPGNDNPEPDGSVGGDGGEGIFFGNIFGSEFGDNGWFAGGGGGGSGQDYVSVGEGGQGGGGDGTHRSGGRAQDGMPNTGGGGGGGSSNDGDRYPGAGGSGIVLVRYRLSADDSLRRNLLDAWKTQIDTVIEQSAENDETYGNLGDEWDSLPNVISSSITDFGLNIVNEISGLVVGMVGANNSLYWDASFIEEPKDPNKNQLAITGLSENLDENFKIFGFMPSEIKRAFDDGHSHMENWVVDGGELAKFDFNKETSRDEIEAGNLETSIERFWNYFWKPWTSTLEQYWDEYMEFAILGDGHPDQFVDLNEEYHGGPMDLFLDDGDYRIYSRRRVLLNLVANRLNRILRRGVPDGDLDAGESKWEKNVNDDLEHLFEKIERLETRGGGAGVVIRNISAAVNEDLYYILVNKDPNEEIFINGTFRGIIVTRGMVRIGRGGTVYGAIFAAGDKDNPFNAIGTNDADLEGNLEALNRGDFAGVVLDLNSGDPNLDPPKIDFYLGNHADPKFDSVIGQQRGRIQLLEKFRNPDPDTGQTPVDLYQIF